MGYGLWQLAYASKQALDLQAYADARASMQSQKADNGKPLVIPPPNSGCRPRWNRLR